MNEYPRTSEDAQKYRYGRRAGTPGQSYKPERCAMVLWEQVRWPVEYQCKRKPGHGPGRLYCKQHAKKVEEVIDHQA